MRAQVSLYIFWSDFTIWKTKTCNGSAKKTIFSHFSPFFVKLEFWHAFCIMCGVTK